MSSGYFEVVTDGNTFRIVNKRYGGETRFVGIPEPLSFPDKKSADDYIHYNLSMSGWKKA